MQSTISTDQRVVNNLDAPDAFRIANHHHRRVKAYHQKRQEQFETKVCLYAKRFLAFWCEVKAWHNLASILSLARKGDSVFAIGRIESREHNGKNYKELVAEYLSVASMSCAAASPATIQPPLDQSSELAGDNGELPF